MGRSPALPAAPTRNKGKAEAMAMTDSDRFAVFATAKEALGLTWSNLLPYLVLVFIMMLPWAAANALGAFDALSDYAARMGQLQGTAGLEGYGLEGYPFGALMLLSVGSFFMMVVFGIFWMRYTLLGRDGALKFSAGQFNGMFWRTTGYGLAAVVIGLLAFAASLVAVMVTGGLIGGLLSVALGPAAMLVMVPFGIVAYALPLAVMVRLSLPFPAIALGQRLSFKGSWSMAKGATWRVVGAMVAVGLPFLGIGYGLQLGLFYGLVGVKLWEPAASAAVLDNWWLTFIIGPVTFLPVALALAIVAIAYRDLSGSRRSVELPAGTSLA